MQTKRLSEMRLLDMDISGQVLEDEEMFGRYVCFPEWSSDP